MITNCTIKINKNNTIVGFKLHDLIFSSETFMVFVQQFLGRHVGMNKIYDSYYERCTAYVPSLATLLWLNGCPLLSRVIRVILLLFQ